MKLVTCFGILVVSGNGQMCNDLKRTVRECLSRNDELTGECRTLIFKYGNKKYPEVYQQLRKELGQNVNAIFSKLDLESKYLDHQYLNLNGAERAN